MQFLRVNADFLSTSKLCALDEYWSNNNSHPIHQKINEIIQTLIIQRGEKTFKQKRLFLLRNLERSMQYQIWDDLVQILLINN